MFGWDFAKSAEAIFSRWAVKRICKFLLKKKLGDYILGDIDLDQLDVQLRGGTIQLNDLALNVDFLNRKLGNAVVKVKEGSIASLSVKIPWKMQNCQIEVEELELVVSPCVPTNLSPAERTGVQSEYTDSSSRETEKEHGRGTPEAAILDVHEGVKTIAKIVKLILTSFHIRLKNLILAFDPDSVVDKLISNPYRNLVLRIAEIEYGTYVSETVVSDSKPESILGITKLTNFIKFKGAMVEFLEVNDRHGQPRTSLSSGGVNNEFYSDNVLSGFTTRILSGATCGFSGRLNLTIPWNNGCLDIHKVDTDISIEPVTLTIQPSTILWLIVIWEFLTSIPECGSGVQHYSIYNNKSCHSSLAGPFVSDKETITQKEENFTSGLFSSHAQKQTSNALLPVANVIHNWVPLSNNFEDNSEMDPDYGSSIDQFFECFDGMRSSHASLSNSGIWNWTCSVFSAITAASSLASGCGNGTTEEQNIESNIKASISAISVVFFFDDDQKCTSEFMNGCQMMNTMQGTASKNFSSIHMVNTSLSGSGADSYFSQVDKNEGHSAESDFCRRNIDYLNITCHDFSFVLQISPQCTKCDAIISHIEIDGNFYDGNQTFCNFHAGENKSGSSTCSVHHIQSGVHSALPPLSFSYSESENQSDASCNLNFHSVMQSFNDKCEGSQTEAFSTVEPVKVKLFESFGESHGEYSIKTTTQNDKSTTFSLILPPFILWVDFYLVSLLMILIEKVGKEIHKADDPDVIKLNDDNNNAKYTNLRTKDSIRRGNLQGNIHIPNARIILCFGSENDTAVQQFSCRDKFISLDFSRSPDLEKIQNGIPAGTKISQRNSYIASTCVSFIGGSVDVYLVESIKHSASVFLSEEVMEAYFSVTKILSITSGADFHHSFFSVLTQTGPDTGPWVATRALNLAESQDPRSRNNASGKGLEFASVTTAEDRAKSNSYIRKEIVLSSSFLLHIHLSLFHATLTSHEYHQLYILLEQLMYMLNLESYRDSDMNKKDVPHAESTIGVQTSVIMECNVLKICIRMEDIKNIGNSIQKEVPGLWNKLQLNIENFELLTVSDIGGIPGALFCWLSHGEGELWGSVVDVNHNDLGKPEEFLLVTCKNSTLRRGNGEGGNTISNGPAGTSITHLHNPQTHEDFTSVTVHCGTIVAPGCRLDWFDAITSFFALPFCDGAGDFVGSRIPTKKSDSDGDYNTSFFLDLVDVALSYEPKLMYDIKFQSADVSKAAGQQYVGCILAAASLNLSNQTADVTKVNDHIIRLHDVGLLICQWSGGNNIGMYDADYLRESGYVKIAGDAHIAFVVRTNCQEDLLWEVEFSDLHVKLYTCSDTTLALLRLLAQFQQLFTPDIQDALVHLQSRWSYTKGMNGLLDQSKMHENLAINSENNCSAGIMDEVLDDYFYVQENQTTHSDCLDEKPISAHDKETPSDEFNSKVKHCSIDDYTCYLNDISRESVLPCIEPENSQNMHGFYVTELLPKTKPSIGNYSCNVTSEKLEPEGERGSWYRHGTLLFDEDHIAETSETHTEKQRHMKDEVTSISSYSTSTCKVKGRVLLKNTDVRWTMFDGSDWPEANRASDSSSSSGRNENTCLELQLLGLDLQHDMYPDGEIFVSKLSLTIQKFHLHDNSKDAPWKLVLGCYHSKHHIRESFSKALNFYMESVRPDPSLPLEEYRLDLALLPIRLHIDQSHLNFLINFLGLNTSAESSNLANNMDEQGISQTREDSIAEEALLPFFQKCYIRPIVICVDYIPRNIDLASLRCGNFIELINLFPWKGIELQLKCVNSVGVYGWGGICESVVGEWLEDISKNQVHKVLKGLKPIQSLFSVTSGATKLVSLPIKNYRKDQGMIKGLQRGAITFLRSVTLEAVGLGVHLAAGAHDILLQTEHALATTTSSKRSSGRSKSKTNVRIDQPKDVQQGMQYAYESLSDGLTRTASALVGSPIKTFQRGQGTGSALANIVRAVPCAAVTPASSTARAVHCALLGVRNSLDPEHMKDSMEKYHGSSQCRNHRL